LGASPPPPSSLPPLRPKNRRTAPNTILFFEQ
jgi:hypothetical protein